MRTIPARGKAGERGYNMVMLIVAITVLNIMVATVLPLASTDIQRQKEEELVFRGFQYAEAIRLFHNRFQRYPVKLSELLDSKPRCIRQLWKDPMTKDGKWGLIFLNQGAPVGPPGVPPKGGGGNPQTSDLPPDGGDGDLNTPKNGEVVATGPIIGVYSKSHKTAHLIFYGHQRYDEWQFTDSLITNSVRIGGAQAGGGGRLAYSIRWLGRPMPFFNQAEKPLDGTGPGGPVGPGGPNPPPTTHPPVTGKP